MARYYRIPGGFIAVTDEGPKKGPMKGLVLVGRGPKPGGGPETACEQAFAITELQKLCSVRLDEVPDPWLVALGYDDPPTPPVEEIRVDFLPEVFEPKVN